MTTKGYQTLHSHTTTSDGKLTHLELLEKAEKYGLSVVAFTDHDSVPNSKTLNLLIKNKNYLTKWIIGVEISAGLPQELGEESSGGFHIVGLFVDPTNDKLLEHCKKAQEARIKRMEKMVNHLQTLGFKITVDECLKVSGGESVGQPHIVEALKLKPENLRVVEQLRLKMAEDARKDPQIKVNYDSMMEIGEKQYPYRLFLGDDAYIPHVYVDYSYKPTMDEVVSLIRGAGGIAVVAHYFTIKKKISLVKLDNLLKESRLDGAEVVYGIEDSQSEFAREINQERKQVRQLVEKHHKVASGGIDVHKEADLLWFSQTIGYAQETIGMAEQIIHQTKVSTEWSTINS